MRRTIAILALLCGAWSQLAVAECPMTAAPESGPTTSLRTATSHHGHHASAPDTSRSDPASSHHHPGSCGIIMVCAAVPVASRAYLTDAPLPITVPPGPSAGDLYTTTFASQDPPPPRRLPI